MSNPFSVQPTVIFANGAGGSGTDNVTNKTANVKQGYAMGMVSQNGAAVLRYDNNVGPLVFKTNSAAIGGNKTLSIYVVTSEEGLASGTGWTDGVDPNSTSDQSAKIATAPVAAVISNVAASTTYVIPEFSLFSVLGFVPQYWGIVWVLDGTGTAIGTDSSAANHKTKYTEIQYA